MKDNEERVGVMEQQCDKFDNDDDFEFQFGEEDEQIKETREKRKRYSIDEEMDDGIIIVPEAKRRK